MEINGTIDLLLIQTTNLHDDSACDADSFDSSAFFFVARASISMTLANFLDDDDDHCIVTMHPVSLRGSICFHTCFFPGLAF